LGSESARMGVEARRAIGGCDKATADPAPFTHTHTHTHTHLLRPEIPDQALSVVAAGD